MALYETINRVSRLHNRVIMLVLTLTIFGIFVYKAVDTFTSGKLDEPLFDLTSQLGITLMVCWILFSLISFVYMLNGILLNRNFNLSIQRQRKKGKPVEGIRGFDDFKASMSSARNSNILITVSSIVSLLIFVVAVNTSFDTDDVASFQAFILTLAITFAFLTISLLFITDYPEETSFSPGGLIDFYEPDTFRLTIDNLLSDIFISYLDPATYLDIDEWSKDIFTRLRMNFEADETPKTRLERAREKILLLIYLNQFNKDVVSDETLIRELEEMFEPNDVQALVRGDETGLSFDEVKRIIRRIEKLAPEPFRLVDRLMIQLTDDYESFISDDLYFTVSAKTNQGSVIESTGIIAFFLNNTPRDDREFTVQLVGGEREIHPHLQRVKIRLDPLTDPYPAEQPPLVSKTGEDIISLLADVLQTGDAVWFRVKPDGFGYKVITIQAEEPQGRIVGESLEVKFTKSITWYAKTYLPRLSGLGGLVLPVIGGIIGL